VKKSGAVLFIVSLVVFLGGCGAMVGAYHGAQSDWAGFISGIDSTSSSHHGALQGQGMARSDADALQKCEKFYTSPGKGDAIKRAGYITCLQKEFGKTIARDEGCIRLVERECSRVDGKGRVVCEKNMREIATIQKSKVFSDRRDEVRFTVRCPYPEMNSDAARMAYVECRRNETGR